MSEREYFWRIKQNPNNNTSRLTLRKPNINYRLDTKAGNYEMVECDPGRPEIQRAINHARGKNGELIKHITISDPSNSLRREIFYENIAGKDARTALIYRFKIDHHTDLAGTLAGIFDKEGKLNKILLEILDPRNRGQKKLLLIAKLVKNSPNFTPVEMYLPDGSVNSYYTDGKKQISYPGGLMRIMPGESMTTAKCIIKENNIQRPKIFSFDFSFGFSSQEAERSFEASSWKAALDNHLPTKNPMPPRNI